MNPQANTNPTPSDKPKLSHTGRPNFQQRKPHTGTRSTSVPGTSVVMTPRPHSAVAQTGHVTTGPRDHTGHNHTSSPSLAHRIVIGKGAKKPIGPHIAGARMNIMRKESRPMKRGGPARSLTHTQGEDVIPALAPDSIRIIPLGGVEEIGRNTTAIEFGNDIIVVDIGFQFKDENTPGIDYILPNTKYLEERQSKIRAVLITHGHLDHVGGIPYIMPRIGNPPMYTRLLTSVLIQKRQEEFPDLPKIDRLNESKILRCYSHYSRCYGYYYPDSIWFYSTHG